MDAQVVLYVRIFNRKPQRLDNRSVVVVLVDRKLSDENADRAEDLQQRPVVTKIDGNHVVHVDYVQHFPVIRNPKNNDVVHVYYV